MHLEVSSDLIWKPILVKSASELNFVLTSSSKPYGEHFRERARVICMQLISGILVWKNNTPDPGFSILVTWLELASCHSLLERQEKQLGQVNTLISLYFTTWALAKLKSVHPAPSVWELIDESLCKVINHSLGQGFSNCGPWPQVSASRC